MLSIYLFGGAIERYLNNREWEKVVLRIENRINGMNEKERLDILNSQEFKEWNRQQWDFSTELDYGDCFGLLKEYMMDNLKTFLK